MNRFFLPSPNSQASMSSLSTHGRNPHFRFQTLLLFSSYYLYYFVLFLTSKSPMPQNVQTNSIFCFWTSCQCKHLTTDASRSPCHTHIHTPTAMSTLQGSGSLGAGGGYLSWTPQDSRRHTEGVTDLQSGF